MYNIYKYRVLNVCMYLASKPRGLVSAGTTGTRSLNFFFLDSSV